VSLWPKMANNDAYYFSRITWMIGSLAIVMWSLTEENPAHYIVTSSSACPQNASECNVAKDALMQHYVCLAIFIVHPIAYGLIQIVQYRQYRHEYEPADKRAPDQLTSF